MKRRFVFASGTFNFKGNSSADIRFFNFDILLTRMNQKKTVYI